MDDLEKSTTIALACAADDKFATPLAVSLYSALSNIDSGYSIYLYIIDGGIKNDNKKKIERIIKDVDCDVTLNWISSSTFNLSSVQTVGWVSKSALLRLFISDVIPTTFDKVIYIDSDVVVEGSLSELWKEPHDDAAVLAVRDLGIPYVSSPLGIAKHEELGIHRDSPYFNSGILVINLERWREDSVGEKAIQYLKTHKDSLNFNDQEALNAVLANDWNPIDAKWNVSLNPKFLPYAPESPFKREVLRRQTELLRDPHIYHFSGPDKPWTTDTNHPEQHRWFRYLWRSGWLSSSECLKSVLRFYPRYISFLLRRSLTKMAEKSRPGRHWLTRRAPALSPLLKRSSVPANSNG